jgi:hypothetical protein
VGHLQLETGPALADPDVEVVESAGSHPDQDLARARFRVGDVGILEDVQIAMFEEAESFHGVFLLV